MSNTIEHYLTAFNQQKAFLSGSGEQWVLNAREEAMEQFRCSGFPTRRNEEWKYTDLKALSNRAFTPPSDPDLAQPRTPDRSTAAEKEAITLRFEDGRWLSLKAGLDLPPPGVTITSLGKMLTDFPDRIKEHLALFNNPSEHALVPLNTAFAQDGAFIYLEKNVVLEQPLTLEFRTARGDRPRLSVPRNLIILSEGASLTLVEKHVCEDNAAVYWSNSHTEIQLGKGSQMDHVQLQLENTNAYHTILTKVQQARDSHYRSTVFSLGGRLARSDLDISLEDKGAACELNGLYLLDGEQHVDHHTRIDHLEPDCSSSELYKGIFSDSSRGVFNGKVYVHPDAQRTVAYQSNPNLLLSRSAEIDTKPQLEIFADDVKCSHGATVGQLDSDALFFLRSRGIDENQAINILLSAFTEEIVQKVRNADVRSELSALVSRKIQHITTGREVL